MTSKHIGVCLGTSDRVFTYINQRMCLFICLFILFIIYLFKICLSIFPECVARVPVSLGGLGVRLCSPSFAFAFATVRKCPQPSACPP